MRTDAEGMWSATRTLIGTMIGVGILGLPYAILQVGVGLGLLELCLVAAVSFLVLRLYSDLVLVRGGKARFLHVVGRELGHFGTGIAGFAYIGATVGALLAFLIFGGQFLRVVLFDVVPLTVPVATVIFFLMASFCTLGGTLTVVRIQRFLIPLFFCLIAILMIVAAPQMTTARLFAVMPGNIGVPFGVMLFAFHGISAVPEMRDILGRQSRLLPKAILRAMVIVAAVYAVFSIGMLAVTGAATTENALLGLSLISQRVVFLASAVALLTTLTAYMNVATSLTNTFLYDGKMRLVSAWLLTACIPFGLFFLGARHVSSVLSMTGGILGSLTAIMMLIAYERARVSAELPKHSLQIPQWTVALAFVVYAVAMVMTIVG